MTSNAIEHLWITTAQEARELDQRTSDEHGIRAADLMEEAGRAVFRVTQNYLGKARRIAVFCGPGNNGGDGLVVARVAHLAGNDVTCFLTSPVEKLSELTLQRFQSLASTGISPVEIGTPQWDEAISQLSRYDVIVDAILGTGSCGALKPPLQGVVQAINNSGVRVVSIDIPTGIDTYNGVAEGESIFATETVAIGWAKRGHFQGDGVTHTGKLTVEPINFPQSLRSRPTGAFLVSSNYVKSLLPTRQATSHKGTSGKVLIVAGSREYTGAATLATLGALRGGAGLAMLASTKSVCPSVLQHAPESIVLAWDGDSEIIGAELADYLIKDQSRYDAAIIGPGLGEHQGVAEFFARLLPEWRVPTVYDASALTYVQKGRAEDSIAILTPHPGEMARMLDMSIRDVQANRFDCAARAADEMKATVVLKGVYSVITAPDRIIRVNPTGNPGMATGGMGDVLGGLIATFLAQGVEPQDAATLGTYLHGAAGDLCRNNIGSIGFTATEVAAAVPQARDKLLQS